MSRDFMDYNSMVESALRQVVRQALERVVTQGLPGGHHFYISFRTDFAGVDVPEYLRARYPEEMTIVLQHQFGGLHVDAEQFGVTLNFNKVPEHLVVPLAAVTAFADPSVNFGLQFHGTAPQSGVRPGADAAPLALKPATQPKAPEPEVKPAKPEPPDDDGGGGKVVALDAFRKKT